MIYVQQRMYRFYEKYYGDEIWMRIIHRVSEIKLRASPSDNEEGGQFICHFLKHGLALSWFIRFQRRDASLFFQHRLDQLHVQ